jgi:hypothetical protein
MPDPDSILSLNISTPHKVPLKLPSPLKIKVKRRTNRRIMDPALSSLASSRKRVHLPGKSRVKVGRSFPRRGKSFPLYATT